MNQNGDKQYIAQKIREWRLKRNWSQQQLANGTGLLRETISYVENAQRHIKAADLAKIARALEVNAGEFFPQVETRD